MPTPAELWDEQLAAVYTMTNRPALVDETNMGVRMGTLRAHLSDHYPRDIVVTDVDPDEADTSATSLTIATSTDFTRFRDVAMVQLRDSSGDPLDMPEVEIVELGGQYDPNYRGVKKPYVAWLAGTSLNIYAACGTYGARVQWYQSPITVRATYDSWIAQIFPDIIQWEAAMFVWNRTGNEAKAKEAKLMLHGDGRNPETGLYSLLKANYLTTTGR
jgi:hypothetical protein